MAVMRLDKFFSSQNLATRKEMRELVKNGLIAVNGDTRVKPEQKIDPQQDEISLRGEPVTYKPYLYLMLHKPKGYVSATEDRSQPTVLDLVPEQWRRPGLFPAGRLDKDTTGLMLITDDGELAHRILSPKNHIEKAYLAKISGPLSEEAMAAFSQGMVLGDGYRCLPARVTLEQPGETPVIQIVLWEGKYHQIKRMVAAAGQRVLELKRIRMGGLVLDENLPEGACREILHKDVEKFLLSEIANYHHKM